MALINVTDENAHELRDAVIYAAAVVTQIKATVAKYGECYVEERLVRQIWTKRWIDATGNVKDRIKTLAKNMNMNVEWTVNQVKVHEKNKSRKLEVHFTRKIEVMVPRLVMPVTLH